MKRVKIFAAVILTLAVIIIACQKEKVATLEYPRLKTLPVTEINESGANFSAEIISGDVLQIKECGFVWNAGDKLIINEGIENNRFSARAHSALVKGLKYEIYSYVKTEDYTVYGNKVSFISLGSEAPVIEDFTPKTGTWGDTIRITGKNFRYAKEGIGVRLDNVNLPVISSTDTKITVVIPSEKNAEKANLTVSILGNSSTSTSQFTYNLPVITRISPTNGTWGDSIKITGKNFKYTSGIEVKLGNINLPVISNTNTTIIALIPEKKNSEKSAITVSILGFSSTSVSQFSYNLPQISSINPLTGTFNDTISVQGNSFSKDSVMNKIYFNEIRAKIIYNSPTLIKVIVPESLNSVQSKISMAGPVANIEYGTNFGIMDIILGSFEPDTAFVPNQIITIKGENFNPLSINNKITINGAEASIVETSASQIKVRIPSTLIPSNDFSFFGNGEISLTSSQRNAKFNNKIEFYIKRRWTKLKDFPGNSRLAGFGFSIGDRGFIGFGYDGKQSGLYYNDFWEYDQKNDTWTRKSDFAAGQRVKASVFTLGNEAYLGLGCTKDIGYNYGIPYLKDFYKYDLINDKWIKINDYPGRAKASAATFVKDGCAYVGTGIIKDTIMQGNTDDDEIWKYNPNTAQWSKALKYPIRTMHGFGFTIGNSGFIYNQGEIKEYADNSWIYRGYSRLVYDWDLVTFTIGNCGYIMSNYSDMVEYNNLTGQTRGISIPAQVKSTYPSVFTVNNKAYIVCGVQQGLATQNVWEFDPSK